MNSKHLRRNFQLTSPYTTKPKPDAEPTSKPKVDLIPCNFRNPLQDYSLKSAKAVSETKNPFRLKQMKISAMYPEDRIHWFLLLLKLIN